DDVEVALRPDAGCRDLRLHVAEHQIRQPDVGAQYMPDLIVAPAFFIDLDCLEAQALGIAVDRIDDPAAAGRVRTDIEMVRRRHREANELPLVKGGYHKGHVGPMTRARIRIVVNEYVAGLDLLAALGNLTPHSTDVTRNRSRLQRRALFGLGELAVLDVN